MGIQGLLPSESPSVLGIPGVRAQTTHPTAGGALCPLKTLSSSRPVLRAMPGFLETSSARPSLQLSLLTGVLITQSCSLLLPQTEDRRHADHTLQKPAENSGDLHGGRRTTSCLHSVHGCAPSSSRPAHMGLGVSLLSPWPPRSILDLPFSKAGTGGKGPVLPGMGLFPRGSDSALRPTLA